jgi:hypothetical protein
LRAWPACRVLPRAARALQVHVHARQHFLGLDRLGDVVDAARLQRRHQVLGFGQPGHEDDGNVRRGGVGLQAARHLEAVDARHHRVEQHDVGQRLRGALQRLLAAGGHQHRVARFVERVVQHRRLSGTSSTISTTSLLAPHRAACGQGRWVVALLLSCHAALNGFGQRAAHGLELELARQHAHARRSNAAHSGCAASIASSWFMMPR